MSDATTFDTMEFVEELKAAGVPEKQAMAQVRILSKATREHLVTQGHLDLRMAELKADMREMEYRIIIRLGGIMIAGFSALAVLMKLH
ncbi:DUF1640 domain-containing protein [uncultured Gammaproteobacteria bacterium]